MNIKINNLVVRNERLVEQFLKQINASPDAEKGPPRNRGRTALLMDGSGKGQFGKQLVYCSGAKRPQ